MSQLEYEDDYGTPEQKVLQCHWLLMEIAQWDYQAYRTLSQLNRKGGVLALDQSLYYRSWRNELKRQSTLVLLRYDAAGTEFRRKRTWDCILKAPGLQEYRGPEPHHWHEGELHDSSIPIIRHLKFGHGENSRLFAYRKDMFGTEWLKTGEKGATRSKRMRVRQCTDKEIEWFNAEFEKYRKGPFPSITE